MQNIHGPLEWVSVQDMARATEMCIELAQLWAREHHLAHAVPSEDGREATADAGSLVDWVG
jgi:tripeptide aminopeptidase